MYMPKTRRCTWAICRSPAYWTPSLIPMNGTARGSSERADTAWAEWWREFVSTLRMFGYDYVLSIEHEDTLLSPEEA